ncbi:MAG TPA: preprotein translocase subunit SecE [Patescibacteria group bacterium]|nr:preprotein translocase subunit SecE [Patescibacteria group bacterium]
MPQANPAKFFGEVKAELLKVTWPGREEVTRLTAVVIIISLVVGAFIGGLDFIFTKIIELIL